MKKYKLFATFDDKKFDGKINRLLVITTQRRGDSRRHHSQDVYRWGKVAVVLLIFLVALYDVGILGGKTTSIIKTPVSCYPR